MSTEFYASYHNNLYHQINNPNPLTNTENNLIATLTMLEMRSNTLQLFFFPNCWDTTSNLKSDE